jgi:hypothetical protein
MMSSKAHREYMGMGMGMDMDMGMDMGMGMDMYMDMYMDMGMVGGLDANLTVLTSRPLLLSQAKICGKLACAARQ